MPNDRSAYQRQYYLANAARIKARAKARLRDGATCSDCGVEITRHSETGKCRTCRPRRPPEEIAENARRRRQRWSEANAERERQMKLTYARDHRKKMSERRNERRASDPEVQRRENVVFRLSKATGIAAGDLPEDLIEAKIIQLRVRAACRRNTR